VYTTINFPHSRVDFPPVPPPSSLCFVVLSFPLRTPPYISTSITQRSLCVRKPWETTSPHVPLPPSHRRISCFFRLTIFLCRPSKTGCHYFRELKAEGWFHVALCSSCFQTIARFSVYLVRAGAPGRNTAFGICPPPRVCGSAFLFWDD